MQSACFCLLLTLVSRPCLLCWLALLSRRKENLAARATTKLENKKAKRDKKLLRAGFEGRKSGFINAPKAKASS